jgi:hypothetical protein
MWTDKGIYTHEKKPEDNKPKTLAEKLMEQADEETKIGKSLAGCTFIGQHPSTAHFERASVLRQAALSIRKSEKR